MHVFFRQCSSLLYDRRIPRQAYTPNGQLVITVTCLHQETQLTMIADPACCYCEIVHSKVSKPLSYLVPLTDLPLEQHIAYCIQLVAHDILSNPPVLLFIFSCLLLLRCVKSCLFLSYNLLWRKSSLTCLGWSNW